jgi:hypothetical protein
VWASCAKREARSATGLVRRLLARSPKREALSASKFRIFVKTVFMEGVILHTDSEKNLNVILQLAKKLGISIRKLSKEEIEDFGLALAIAEGETGEYIDTEEFLEELEGGN